MPKASETKRLRFNWITFDFMFAGSVSAAVTAACLIIAIPLALALGAGPIGGILIGAAVLGALFGFALKRYLMNTKKNVRKPKDLVAQKEVSASSTDIYTTLKVTPQQILSEQVSPPAAAEAALDTKEPPEVLSDESMSIAKRSDAAEIFEMEALRAYHRVVPSRRDDAY